MSDKFNEYLSQLVDAFNTRDVKVIEAFLYKAQEELKDDDKTFERLLDAATAINKTM